MDWNYTWGEPSYNPSGGSFAVESAQDAGLPNTFDFNWDDMPWQTGGASVSTYGFNDSDGSGSPTGGYTNLLDPKAAWRSDPYNIYYQFKNPDGSMKYFINNKMLNEQYRLGGQTNLNPTAEAYLNAPGINYSQGQFFDQDPMTGLRNPYKVSSANVNKLWDSIDKVGLPVGMALVGGLAGLMNPGAAGAASSIPAASIGSSGMSLAPSAFGPAMDAALGSTAGAASSMAVPGAISSGLAGAMEGISSSLGDIFSKLPVGSDSGFNIPASTQSGSFVTEGAGSMLDDIFSIANEGPWGTAMQSIPESNLMPWEIGASNVGQFSTTPELWNSLSSMGSGALGAASETGMLEKLFDFMKSPQGQLAKTGLNLAGKFGSAAMSNNAAKRMQDQLVGQMDKYQQAADPFGPQRPYYQDELKRAYLDPSSIYAGDEYQSLKKIFEEGIRRRDAAQGRRNSNEFPRAIELQDHFMKYLGDYRKGLNAPAGVDINPNGLFGAMLNNFQQGQQQRYNALGGYTNALGSLFDPYENQKNQLNDRLTSFLERLV